MNSNLERTIFFFLIACFFSTAALRDGTVFHIDDFIIPGYDPPKDYFDVPGGGCGEACLWTVIHARGRNATQAEINRAGGNPGRGLHSNELFFAMEKYGIHYSVIPGRVNDFRTFLHDEIIGTIKRGRPVLLGVKIYPDLHPRWACDHFILLIGYNRTTGELIFNSNNRMERVPAEKFLDMENGYSIVNAHRYVFAVKF